MYYLTINTMADKMKILVNIRKGGDFMITKIMKKNYEVNVL